MCYAPSTPTRRSLSPPRPLRFTAAARPGTLVLLNQLLAVIDAANGPSTSRGSLELALFAVDTIARQFVGSPDTAARLAARTLSRWELGRVAALCRGWPDHPAVHDLYEPAPPGQPMWADRELHYALLPTSQLIGAFGSAAVRVAQAEPPRTPTGQAWAVHYRLASRLRGHFDLGCRQDRSPGGQSAHNWPYARGLAGYLQVCERDGVDPLAAGRAQVAAIYGAKRGARSCF
jgi:hypothetical protein